MDLPEVRCGKHLQLLRNMRRKAACVILLEYMRTAGNQPAVTFHFKKGE